MASHYATSVGLGDNTDQKACPVSETTRTLARRMGWRSYTGDRSRRKDWGRRKRRRWRRNRIAPCPL